MSKKTKLPKPPTWLKEFRKSIAFLKIIDMAYDPKVPDRAVRMALIDTAKDLNELAKLTGGP